MPTVIRRGLYRLFFYSNAAHELRRIERVVAENRRRLLEAWNEHLGDRG